jgi:D-alanyl-D-alanine carboxypeptidase
MRNLFLLLILLITTAKSVSSQDVEDQLQYTLDSICTEQGLVGISAAVRLGNQLVWSGTSGYNNPYTEDTLRVDMNGSIASNTKMFTSVSLLQLVSEGKIALEDTIGTWQPSSPIINGSITIRQLLNHTSGLGDYTTQQWVDSIQSNPARIWTIDELFTTFLTNPVDEPGIKFKYSNAGYLILGKIIEIIEDKPFSQILHERIFEPLAMTYTYTPIDDQPNSEVMLPWFDIDNDGELDNMLDYSMNAMHSSALSAGYIYSTPEDLSKFLPALFDNSLFNQNLLEEMTTTLPASSLYHYGLGILEYTIFDKPYFGHTGQYIGYQSFTSYEPESKLSIAFILNQTFADSYEIGKVLGQKAYNYILSTKSNDDLSSSVGLHQNYPNPTDHITAISYTIPLDGFVSLEVFDSMGNKVETLVDSYQKAGLHHLSFDASNLKSGLYFYKLTYDDVSLTRSMIRSK